MVKTTISIQFSAAYSVFSVNNQNINFKLHKSVHFISIFLCAIGKCLLSTKIYEIR